MENNSAGFLVRDMRRKEKFQMDDAYMNGFARICGIYATGVYMALCRHANSDQEAWPSVETMAEKLAVSKRSVLRAISTLEAHQIIGIIRDRTAKGHRAINVYVLIDKSMWIRDPENNSSKGQVTDSHSVPGDCSASVQVTGPGDCGAPEGNKGKETQLKDRKKSKNWTETGRNEPTSVGEVIDRLRGQLVMEGVLPNRDNSRPTAE